MPVAQFDDLIDQDVEVSDDTARALICRADDARVLAAYWQGKCEGLETTLAYLKDRLNRIETPKRDQD